MAAALDAVNDELRARGWQLLVHKTHHLDVVASSALARAGFDPLCIHLDHIFDLERIAAEPPGVAAPEGITFGAARREEADIIGELSSRSYAPFDRYQIDPLLPDDRAPEIYREWARNSVRGYANLVWVARREEEPIGFATFHRTEALEAATGVVWWDFRLLGVSTAARGQRLSWPLVDGAFRHIVTLGGQRATSATNAVNAPAQRLFRRFGAWIHTPIHTFRRDLTRD